MNEKKTVAKVIIGGTVTAAVTVITVGIAAFKIAKKAITNSYITDDEATNTAATIDGNCEEVEDQELRDLYGMDTTDTQEETE